MKIATYNAASVRAREESIVEWLAVNEPDILAIQETKVEDDKFPLMEFEGLGYQVALNGQKSWNGVAILSRSPIQNVQKGFPDDLFPNDARLIAAEIDGVQVINTYVPNGNTVGSDKWEYKLRWLERFDRFLRESFRPDQPLIWLGDINIAPKPIDVYDSPRMLNGVGHHPDEFVRLNQIVDFGLTDIFRMIHPDTVAFTFWDFVLPNGVKRNLGWRIDHIYATRELAGTCTSVSVDLDARLQEKPSDHTYVVAEFDF
jgi:exodeoxyribonuclease-3